MNRPPINPQPVNEGQILQIMATAGNIRHTALATDFMTINSSHRWSAIDKLCYGGAVRGLNISYIIHATPTVKYTPYTRNFHPNRNI
ncbi:hypothetical protein FHS86_000377 [Roseimarinus sediminis]